ncbi:MAG TPA: tRNA lysidine(34) synthetase TilS [Pirellulales bacterium]|nr:tRNA lysidine(34) synthetase TilS [Pirellulales bacterium]
MSLPNAQHAADAGAVISGPEAPLVGLWLPDDWNEVTTLAAVSGGADSVALLRALAAMRPAGPGRLVVAHFNHRLRGSAADADAAFVAKLAGELGLPCDVGSADAATVAPALRDGNRDRQGRPMDSATECRSYLAGIEESARNVRYEFLKAAAGRCGARYVATAHTADDQAETVLHRIVRGTGLSGLSGMRRARPLMHGVSLIRPLLGVRRAELLDYLGQLGQQFCDDATNQDLGFTRNRLRHELLPRLAAEYNSQVIDALLRLARLAGEAQAVIAALVDELLPDCARNEADRIVFDCVLLADQPRYVVRELLLAAWRRRQLPEQAMGFAQWDELADLVQARVSGPLSTTLPGGIRVCRESDSLVIMPVTRDLCP